MKSLHFLLGITCIASLTGCVSSAQVEPNSNLDRARQTLDSLYLNYSVDNSSLLRENYPSEEKHTVTYLASEEQANIPKQFSYLWPYSGTFSAVNAPAGVYLCMAVPNAYRLRWTPFEAVSAALTFFNIKQHRVVIIPHITSRA